MDHGLKAEGGSVDDDAGLTLGAVLDQAEFGLKALVLPQGWEERTVVGAHSVDVHHPNAWLDADWLALTTGAQLKGSGESQRRFVQDLVSVNASGLLFGTGIAFKSIPTALVDEAEHLGLPLFKVPIETPFRSIIGFVYRSTIDSETRDFTRLTAMQRYLMGALGDERALDEVMRRLSKVCGATTALMNREGAVEAATATFPARASQAYLSDKPPTMIKWDHDGWSMTAVPVHDGPEAHRWLLTTRRSPYSDRRFIASALQAAAPLIAALSAVMTGARAQERATRAALFRSVLEASNGIEVRTVAYRAAALGVDLTTPGRIFALRRSEDVPEISARTSLKELDEVIAHRLEEAGVAYLAVRRKLTLLLLLQGNVDEVDALMAEMLDEDLHLRIGRSEPITDFPDVPQGVRDAELAVMAARHPQSDRDRSFGSLGLGILMLGHVNPEQLAASVAQVLTPLRDNPILIESLREYFACHLDIPKASAVLHLHPNTLRYRLDRIENIVGASLRDPLTITNLQLALMFDEQFATGPDDWRPVIPNSKGAFRIKSGAGADGVAMSSPEGGRTRTDRGAAGRRP